MIRRQIPCPIPRDTLHSLLGVGVKRLAKRCSKEKCPYFSEWAAGGDPFDPPPPGCIFVANAILEYGSSTAEAKAEPDVRKSNT